MDADLVFNLRERKGGGLGLLFKMWLGLFALFKFFKTPEDAMTKFTLFLAQTAPATPAAPAASGDPEARRVSHMAAATSAIQIRCCAAMAPV